MLCRISASIYPIHGLCEISGRFITAPNRRHVELDHTDRERTALKYLDHRVEIGSNMFGVLHSMTEGPEMPYIYPRRNTRRTQQPPPPPTIVVFLYQIVVCTYACFKSLLLVYLTFSEQADTTKAAIWKLSMDACYDKCGIFWLKLFPNDRAP